VAFPTPEPGLVLNYAYLWHAEHRAGREEGTKDRPSVVVICTRRDSDQALIVTVLPITHSSPEPKNTAVEIPQSIKKHLGLDDQRSWIIIAEGNEFVWPGYDVRKVPGADRFDHGFLPPRFFDRVRDAFVDFARAGKQKATKRN
jgi:PemK-like, MazF-like toxin of type II toxin-antitoxin system